MKCELKKFPCKAPEELKCLLGFFIFVFDKVTS